MSFGRFQDEALWEEKKLNFLMSSYFYIAFSFNFVFEGMKIYKSNIQYNYVDYMRVNFIMHVTHVY